MGGVRIWGYHIVGFIIIWVNKSNDTYELKIRI